MTMIGDAMKLLELEEIKGKEIQKAKSIEVGIINPIRKPILVAENGCIALDMNHCTADDLRALADAMGAKKKVAVASKVKAEPKKVEEKPKKKLSKKKK